MAVSLNDMDVLRQNPLFKARVRAAIVEGAIAVASEAWSVPFHRERSVYVTQILNDPDVYLDAFSGALATNTTVINAATQGGTVALTSGNVDTQQALATDGNIRTGLGVVFNSFFRAPS
jgi:hypothetical protein